MAYKIGRDLHLDVDIIMRWPLSKFYEYVAFYITEDKEWQDKNVIKELTADQKNEQVMRVLTGREI